MVLFIIIYKTAGYNRFNNTLKIAGRLAFVTIDNKKIGKRIREARVKRHLTQEELAEGGRRNRLLCGKCGIRKFLSVPG